MPSTAEYHETWAATAEFNAAGRANFAAGHGASGYDRRDAAAEAEMEGDCRFWIFFGGIWLICGVLFLAGSLGVILFADPEAINPDMPMWPFLAVGLVAAAAGWHIMGRGYDGAARFRRLTETGIELTATVTGVRRSAIQINRQWRWHVAYRYEYPARHPQEGESQALADPAVQGFRPGDRVRIKADPAHPEDSLYIGPA